jgi:acetyl-CoA synthetase
MPSSSFVWIPDPQAIRATRLSAFLREHGLHDHPALVARADAEPRWFWDALIRFFDIRFSRPYREILDTTHGVEWARWCVDGETNLVANCLDRHRASARADQAAILWQGEDGTERAMSYTELDRETCRLAGALSALGVRPGEVVALYLPMVPETMVAFFAVAKIGAIVMPLFSGFGPEPLRDRLLASGACAVITTDVTWRRGNAIPMKQMLDDAIEPITSLRNVVVLQRGDTQAPMRLGRDVYWHDIVTQAAAMTVTRPMPADAPVMVMYTSGTTGPAKGTVHTHCGMLVKNALDVGLCLDVRADDRLMWLSDLGWVAGTKVIVSAPLLGATLVMAEGAPDFPHPARQWLLAEHYRVTHCGTVPTAIRQLMRHNPEILDGIDLSSLRALITAGEPWNEAAWLWCFQRIGMRRVPILNYGGGTECGGAILIGTMHHPLKPCSFGGPVPGMGADIVDADARPVQPGEIGELVLRRPSIGLTRGLWRDDRRYLESYWQQIPGLWVQGDLAMRDADDRWFMLGRSDDTIKLAGRRTGPAEIEAVLMATGRVLEAAAIGHPDPVTGNTLVCVCVASAGDVDAARLQAEVAAHFGNAYRPKHVLLVDDLPKTRNQKVMRRVIRAVLACRDPGDLSALVNPESLDMLAEAARAAGLRP